MRGRDELRNFRIHELRIFGIQGARAAREGAGSLGSFLEGWRDRGGAEARYPRI
jgi:hypothetical protein